MKSIILLGLEMSQRTDPLTEGNRRFSAEEWQSITDAVARLRASVVALVCAALTGTLLFIATIWLVIRGPAPGESEIGPHLRLLNNFFPGYEVSVVGAVIGFLYGALLGAILGWVFSIAYNKIAARNSNI